jgi:DNA polymerase-3 subunit delta'
MMIYPWQQEIWQRLVAGRAQLPNALLLHGRKGTGKLDFGRALAHALLCENPQQSGEACGQCGSCGWLEAGVHPDLRVLEPEAQSETPAGEGEGSDQPKAADKKASQFITVAQIRELSDFVNLTTHRNGLRIVLVSPAESMNIHAANALLKTLEEPPANTLFILVTHQLPRLLPTVRSRCQMISMPLPSSEMAANWLREQGVLELDCLAQAGGAPLAALDLSDADYQQQRGQVIELLAAPERLDPLAMAEQGEKLGLASMVGWLQQWVYDLISLNLAGRARFQPEASAAMIRLANAINLIELFRFQQELSVVQRTLQHPLNNRLVLEQLLYSYWQLVNRQDAGHVRS